MKYSQEIINILKQGGIGVMPTDTIYGIVACAQDEKAVERVYEVRHRRPDKPCIILIADISDLEQFGVKTVPVLARLWPGAVSVILPCHEEAPAKAGRDALVYLHRGTNKLAFRLPASEDLRELLRATGPLIAPSANLEGMKPATTIAEAKAYFEDRVDFYLPVGAPASADVDMPLIGEPSTLVEIKEGRVVVLREGSAKISTEIL